MPFNASGMPNPVRLPRRHARMSKANKMRACMTIGVLQQERRALGV